RETASGPTVTPPTLRTVKVMAPLWLPMGTLPKSAIEGVMLRVPGGTPLPASTAVAVFTIAPAVRAAVKVAALFPVEVGAKTTTAEQVAPAGSTALIAHVPGPLGPGRHWLALA